MKHRPERVVNLIKEELSNLVARELEFPGSLVTIIDAEIDKKFGRAIVNFSVLPSDKFDQALRILERSRRHLQYLLMKKINIKPMPEIIFKADRGLEKAAEIEKILIENKIEE